MMVGETGYTKDFYEHIYPSGRLRRFSINWWSARFYALLADRMIAGKRGRIFDAGCGMPFILARLEDKHETWGIDMSQYAMERAQKIAPRSKLFLANIEDGIPEEIPRNYFDLVIAKYIFEHLRDPGRAISLCYDLLTSGGQILISVPNTRSPMRKLKKDDWFGVKDVTHVSLLDPSEWMDLVRACGFEIRKVFSDGFWDVPYIRSLPSWLQYPLFSIPCALEVFFAYPMLPPGWGENIIMIAAKQEEITAAVEGRDVNAGTDASRRCRS